MNAKDRVAMIIAVGVMAWGVLTIIGLMFSHKSLSEAGGEIFVAIGGGAIAMLATYFATKNNNNQPK
jgi:hypothetical protein